LLRCIFLFLSVIVHAHLFNEAEKYALSENRVALHRRDPQRGKRPKGKAMNDGKRMDDSKGSKSKGKVNKSCKGMKGSKGSKRKFKNQPRIRREWRTLDAKERRKVSA
jgi:hypothetical protein